MKNLKFFLVVVIALWAISFVVVNSFTIVDGSKGMRGILVTMGKVADTTYPGGLVKRLPFVSEVKMMYGRQQRYNFPGTEMKTKDLQKVDFSAVVVYQPNDAVMHKLYADVGEEYQDIILTPLVEGAVNSIIANYEIEYLASSRVVMREAAQYIISDQLAKENLLFVNDFQFTKLHFPAAFEEELEKTLVEGQKVKTSQKITERVKEEALQKYEMLKASAEAAGLELKLKSEALKNPIIVNYEVAKALQKWDGKLKLPSTLMNAGSNANSTFLPIIPINPFNGLKK